MISHVRLHYSAETVRRLAFSYGYGLGAGGAKKLDIVPGPDLPYMYEWDPALVGFGNDDYDIPCREEPASLLAECHNAKCYREVKEIEPPFSRTLVVGLHFGLSHRAAHDASVAGTWPTRPSSDAESARWLARSHKKANCTKALLMNAVEGSMPRFASWQ